MPDHAVRRGMFKKSIKSLKHDIKEEDYEVFADKTEG